MRARFSYGCSRTPRLQPETLTDFADVARVQREWIGRPTEELLTLGFASRGPGDTPPATFRREWEEARTPGLPITQHAERSLQEIARFRRIEMLYQEGLLGPDVQLIHTYNASPEERQMIADTGTPVSHSPFTASRLASGLPYLGDLLAKGVPCSLSLDTITVGGNADMFGVMRLMLQLNHLRAMDVLVVQPRRILELATIDGARDLGLDDRIGSLVPGKRADLILVRRDALNTAPFNDPALLLVQLAQPHNVDTVVVDGRILKLNGQLTALDPEQVVREASEALAAVRARAGGP